MSQRKKAPVKANRPIPGTLSRTPSFARSSTPPWARLTRVGAALAVLAVVTLVVGGVQPGVGQRLGPLPHPMTAEPIRPAPQSPLSMAAAINHAPESSALLYPGQTIINLTNDVNATDVTYDSRDGDLFVAGFAANWTVRSPANGHVIANFLNDSGVITSLLADPGTGNVFAGVEWINPGSIMYVNGSTYRVSVPTNLGPSAAVNVVEAQDSRTGELLYSGLSGLDNFSPCPPVVAAYLVSDTTYQNVTMRWLPGGEIQGAAYDPYTNNFYVSTGVCENNLTVVNAANLSVVATLPNIPSGPVVFDPVNREIYVAGIGSSFYSGVVNVLNVTGTSDNVVAQIPVGMVPDAACFDPLNQFLYVVSPGDNEVSVVNTVTNRAIGSIAIPRATGITYDSASGALFVTNNSLVKIIPNYPRFDLTFAESGLPQGGNWTVSVGNHTYAAASGFSIVVPEFNGNFVNGTYIDHTYSYSIKDSAGWIPDPSSGTVNLTGNPVTVAVQFLSPYGSLQGNVSPANASIRLNNQSLLVSPSGNFSAIDLTAGVYTVTAQAPGYAEDSFRISITSHNQTLLQIRLSRVPVPVVARDTGLDSEGYLPLVGVVGIGAAVAVAAIGVYWWRVRRKPPPIDSGPIPNR